MPQKYQSGGDSFQLKEMLIIGFTTSLTEESWTTKFYEIALDYQPPLKGCGDFNGPFLGWRSNEFATCSKWVYLYAKIFLQKRYICIVVTFTFILWQQPNGEKST